MSEIDQPRAGGGRVLAGLLFGVFAWVYALVTDRGDTRANKALGGCLIWAIVAVVLLAAVGA